MRHAIQPVPTAQAPKWLVVLLILLTIVSIALNVFHRNDNYTNLQKTIDDHFKQLVVPIPRDGRDGRDGLDGETPNVDYEALHKYIDIQVSQLPKPINGKDGVGLQGAAGTSCSTTQLENGASIQCSDGTHSIVLNGIDGTDGVDGKTPQIRCNTNKNRWEIRYSDEDSWLVMGDERVACKGFPI